jgi:hypothetical protein
MKLKKLIENQTIQIDDHKRGVGEIKDWDNTEVDVHIDKWTDYKILGKKQSVRIKIPINSERPIKLTDLRERQVEIPRRLEREIKEAFENRKIRESFMADVVNILKNFNTILDSEIQVRTILERLSRHFDLKWTKEKITEYTGEILEVYTAIYVDDDGERYYFKVDKEKIRAGQQ